MALLSDADRNTALREFVREIFGEQRQRADFDITALREAANAGDVWIDANLASFNSALPVAFRTNASPAQKASLLSCLVRKRADAT